MRENETPGRWEDYHTDVAADTRSMLTILDDIEREEEPDTTGRLHALYDVVLHLDYLNELYVERIQMDLLEKTRK